MDSALAPVTSFHSTHTTSKSTRTRIRCFAAYGESAELYYNAQHDFYALSRYDDVNRARSTMTPSVARGAIIELIKAGFEIPPGTVIFDMPPIHDMHRKCSCEDVPA